MSTREKYDHLKTRLDAMSEAEHESGASELMLRELDTLREILEMESGSRPVRTAALVSLQSFGPGGWVWRVRGEDGAERLYRTTGNGEGLWHCSEHGSEAQQLGLQQYRLPADEAAARAQIARDFRCA